MQGVYWVVAALLVGWSFTDPLFRDAEGYLTGMACLPIAAGLAVFVASGHASDLLESAALWLALALVGQAVALQLIDAGSRLHYQHYRPFDELLTGHYPFLLAFLALQTVLVVVGLRKHGSVLLQRLGGAFKTWQWIGVGLVFVLTSATVSPSPAFYLAELVFATFVQAVNLGGLVVVAGTLPEQTRRWIKDRFDALRDGFTGASPAPARIDRFVLLAALWVTLLAVVLCLFSYERHPHIPDEVTYLFHARVLADGALTAPAPAVPEAFNLYLLQIKDGAWFATPPPGWPLMLAAGAFFGVAWLVNPLLAGLNIVLTYLVLHSLYTRRIARIAVLLLCFSPWYVFMGMNFMPHMFTLTCALLATLGVIRARETGKASRAWLGGFMLGMLALIRPLDALTLAALLGLWAIGIGGKHLKIPAIAGLVLGSMLVGALVLPYNQQLTGDPTVFPIMQYTDEHFHPNANALGFGPDRGLGWGHDPFPGHSPRDAMINANLNGFGLNIELFGWSVGSLLLVSLMVFSGRMRRSDYLMLAVIAAVFTAHFFYYFSGGPDFGARYWFLMIVPLIALAAHGVVMLEERFASGTETTAAAGGYVPAAVLVLCLLSAVTFFPWRAIDKYHHYRDMRPDIRELAATHDFGTSLVLVQGHKHPDYTSAATYNPVDLRSEGPIYAWDENSSVRADVLAAYADRPVWVVEGPALTGAGYRVVAGPLPAAELIPETP